MPFFEFDAHVLRDDVVVGQREAVGADDEAGTDRRLVAGRLHERADLQQAGTRAFRRRPAPWR